jgi:YhgE/Pip-like protein
LGVVVEILRGPKAWGPLLAVVMLAFFYFLVNFGAARNPDANTSDLPVAVVNRDVGVEIGGEPVNFGDRVVEGATSGDRIGDEVEWAKLSSRGEALEGLADGEYYGAIVVPEGYSQAIANLSTLSAGGSPEPARIEMIEILTNASAGPFVSATVRQILVGVVHGASESTGEQITETLETRGARVTPGAATILGESVEAEITDAQPVGENSGRGLMPFYLTFTALILGFIGANAIHGGLATFAETLAARTGRGPSRIQLFFAATVLGLVLALLLGAVEALVAFGIHGVEHEAGAFYVLLFLALVSAVSLLLALVLLAALGPRAGILSGSFLIISLGLATSGGTTPVQSLPGFFRSLSGVLPFENMTEGIRALLFYDGQLEVGLGAALWVLGAYLAGAILLGGSISLMLDAVAQRRKEVHPAEGASERG